MNDQKLNKQATSSAAERETLTSDTPRPEELKGAIGKVLEYLHEERADYDACVERGEGAEGHIYLATLVLASWLEGQQKQTRDDASADRPDILSDRDPMNDAHALLPRSLAETVPPLRATENDPDATVHAKFFTPDSSWTWYVLEFNPADRLCFGLVDGLEKEFGYFSLDELEQVRGPMGLRIERDLYFEPTPLSEIQQDLRRDR